MLEAVKESIGNNEKGSGESGNNEKGGSEGETKAHSQQIMEVHT